MSINVARRNSLNDLAFVRLVGKQLQRLAWRHLGSHERLVLFDDLGHSFGDQRQVILGKGAVPRQIEVVVKTVFNCRTNRELGTRKQLQHRLGKHMSSRVAQDMAPSFGVDGDDRHAVT